MIVVVSSSATVSLLYSAVSPAWGTFVRNTGLQVDSQERTFVAAGNQLYRLNRDLFLNKLSTYPVLLLVSPSVLVGSGWWCVYVHRYKRFYGIGNAQ